MGQYLKGSKMGQYLMFEGSKMGQYLMVVVVAVVENLRAGLEEGVFGLGEILDLGAGVWDEFIG